MFIQVIKGRVKDPAAMLAASAEWREKLRPEATGFLGSTEGVTSDGTYVLVARFESQAAARTNAARPEQTAWWNENKSLFDGEPTFYDCPEVDLMMGGGSDDAGFVQLMIYKPKDVAAVRVLAKEFENVVELRPDILGATTGFATDGTVIDTNYFRSEAEARKGERQEPPANLIDVMRAFTENAGPIEFLDLTEPRFT